MAVYHIAYVSVFLCAGIYLLSKDHEVMGVILILVAIFAQPTKGKP